MCECLFGCSDCENRNNIIYLLYNDEGFGYIGKTTHLHARLKLHRHINNDCGSKKLGKDFKYMILEDNIEEEYLGYKEQSWFDLFNEMCKGKLVNKMRPNGRDMDYFEEQKRVEKLERDYWKVLFADEIREQKQNEKLQKEERMKRKEYITDIRVNNPLKYKAYLEKQKRNYYLQSHGVNSQEEIIAKKEQQKQETKEARKEKANGKIMCVCGCETTRANKSKHEKTKKHLNKTEL
jgi:hypothetical protein